MDTGWQSLEPPARRALAAGAVLLLGLLALAAWWALRTQQAVLFADLRPQDAAVLTGELDKQKVPYTLADNGGTLLVEQSQVHAVRLKLMGKDLPLHGTVGLELFNNTDFGMTEFAQKINYQRALQGELTRTILSLAEIREARVHLALPEQGLFRQDANRPKAAITLQLRQGRSLAAAQVNGIQRLVAAAVPGLAVQEVTVVDQQGVALSRLADAEGNAAGAGRLDLKRETENYLSRKAGAVLESAFGPGQALASVDVTLNMDQVRITTEDVVGAPDGKGGAVTGVLVRERESARDSATPDARGGDARLGRGSSMQRDAEYQTGRRIEHVVSQPGAIRRIQVVALVRHELSTEAKEQVHRLVAAAVGASPGRGDTVVVQSLGAVATRAVAQAAPAAATAPVAAPEPAPASAMPALSNWVVAALALLLLLLLAVSLHTRHRAPQRLRALSPEQRQATLAQVQTWMLQGAPAAATVADPARPGGLR